ncbi:hypothetical protein D9M71_441580 [compost metagenome]
MPAGLAEIGGAATEQTCETRETAGGVEPVALGALIAQGSLGARELHLPEACAVPVGAGLPAKR